jgi:hypothetical protein
VVLLDFGGARKSQSEEEQQAEEEELRSMLCGHSGQPCDGGHDGGQSHLLLQHTGSKLEQPAR